jgi:hypothetical protein
MSATITGRLVQKRIHIPSSGCILQVKISGAYALYENSGKSRALSP